MNYWPRVYIVECGSAYFTLVSRDVHCYSTVCCLVYLGTYVVFKNV